jgi:methyl-accepting chemotaxis protein
MSALKDIAVDLAAERAGEGPAPRASVPKSLREWFSGLSIGGRITFFFTLNLWFALFAGVFAIGGFLELGDRAEWINITHDHALEAERLVAYLSEGRRNAEQMVIAGESKRSRVALNELAEADRTVVGLTEMVRDTNVEAYDRLARIREGIADFRHQIAAFKAGAGDPRRRAAQASEVAATGGAVLEAGREMAQLLGKDADARTDAGADLISTLLFIWVFIAGTLTLITIAAQRYVKQTVSGSLRSMAGQMTQLASDEKDVASPAPSAVTRLARWPARWKCSTGPVCGSSG